MEENAKPLTRWADLCFPPCRSPRLPPPQMDLRNIPEEVVKETPEYKCLQSQFSLLYNESLGVKTQLDEARALLLTAKNAHLRQIEHMEVVELSRSTLYLGGGGGEWSPGRCSHKPQPSIVSPSMFS